MVERNKLIKQFLARNNWENTKINLLAADASFRKYFRVIDGKKSVILMDANPRKEKEKGKEKRSSLVQERRQMEEEKKEELVNSNKREEFMLDSTFS